MSAISGEPGRFDYLEPDSKSILIACWLVVSTHLKNISQIGNLPEIGVKIKHV